MAAFLQGRSKVANGDPVPGTQAIRRAISILKAFNDARPYWSPGPLAEHLGLSKTTVVRMLLALEEEGIVARKDDGRFILGPRLIALGGLAARDVNLRDVAREALEELSRRIGEAVTLEVPLLTVPDREPQMLVVDEINGPQILGARAFIGRSLPLHATSTGKAVMAHLPEAELAPLLVAPLTRFTANTRTLPDQVHADLLSARQAGFAVVEAEFEEGLIAMAAAIVDSGGRPQGAVSVHWPEFRFERSKVAEFGALIRSAASEASERLGRGQ